MNAVGRLALNPFLPEAWSLVLLPSVLWRHW